MTAMDSFRKRAAPLLILVVVYALLWLDLFLPRPPGEVFTATWFGVLALRGIFRTAALVWIGSRLLGAEMELPGRLLPQPKDILDGLGIGACLSALAVAGALFALAAKVQNPLLARYPQAAAPGAAVLALMAAACLATGYSEELFFRFFAVGALARAGFPRSAAFLISGLIFAFAHLGQGVLGVVMAGFYAIVLSFFRIRGLKLHPLAIGHAIYDFAIFLALSFV